MSRSRFSTAAVLFLIAMTAFGQQRSAEGAVPREGWRRPLKPPAVLRDSLPNGLHILFCRVNDLPLVEVSLFVDAGLSQEPADRNGLALITAKLVFAGTPTRTAAQIADELSSLGSTLTSFTALEYSQFYLRTLAKNFRRSIDLLADIAQHPQFPQFAFERQRNAVSASMAATRFNTGEQATREFLVAMYGEHHPVVRSIQGDTLPAERVTLDDVQAFYRTHYRPEHAVLVITGNIAYEALRPLLLDRFGGWQRGGAVQPRNLLPASGEEKRVMLLDQPNTHFAQIRIGFPTPPRSSPQFMAILALNEILGGSSDARLSAALWKKHLISPNVLSAVSFNSQGGYFVVSASCPVARLDSALILMERVLADAETTIPDASELAAAKSALTRGMDFRYATNRSMQSVLEELVRFHLPESAYNTSASMIERLKARDITQAAKTVFRMIPEVIVVSGEKDKLEPLLRQRYGSSLVIIPAR